MNAIPDISSLTNAVQAIAFKVGTTEVIVIVTFVIALINVIWFFWKKSQEGK